MTTSKALRSRNLTAARRSLKLIAEAAAQHKGLLEEDTVPEASFAVHALSYDRALAVVRAVDALDDGDDVKGEGWLATVEVSLDDLDILVGVLRQSDMAIAIEQAGPGSPLGNILAVLEEKGDRE